MVLSAALASDRRCICDSIEKYPDGYLSEPEIIRWEGWAVAIKGPDVDGLDSPKAIIRGSYMEIRAFEIAYHRIRGTAKSSSLMMDSRIAMEAQKGFHYFLAQKSNYCKL
jgi:hypothetical protein